MRKNQFLLILTSSLLILGFSYWALASQVTSQPEFTPIGSTNNPLYKGSSGTKLSIFAENIPQITDIEITPDGKNMLAATLPGKIYVFQIRDAEWKKQSDSFFEIETSQPGFPPEEAGLTGIVLSADFEKNGYVFLNYAYSPQKKEFKNRVTRVTATVIGNKLIGLNPKLIFDANTLGNSSHQIQDGISVKINNIPHLLFGMGEGFDAKKAKDTNLEAGKLILIGEDGQNPEGQRPFDNPKIQAIGLRNPPDLALDPEGNIALSDTGPDHNDRLFHGKLVDSKGNNVKRLDFNWDGEEESLTKNIANPYGSGYLNIYKWANTETPVALNFLSADNLLVTLFGKTGSESNSPGKKILLGTIIHGRQHRIIFKTLVERVKEGEGKLSHPIGTAIDPVTKDIYFGDLMEGRIYKLEGVSLK